MFRSVKKEYIGFIQLSQPWRAQEEGAVTIPGSQGSSVPSVASPGAETWNISPDPGMGPGVSQRAGNWEEEPGRFWMLLGVCSSHSGGREAQKGLGLEGP